jgi:hypothetical protein
MSDDIDLEEKPAAAADEIVHWQPAHRPLAQTHGAVAQGASATGSAIVGAFALGALALGAVAIGALAVGRLSVGRLAVRGARLGKVEIDQLLVRKLTVLEQR